MNAHVICRAGSLAEIEVRPSKEDTDADRAVCERLKGLAQVGAELQCRLYINKGHLVLQLDEPSLE